ncbi:MAG: hypothetical protein Kow0042_18260 [Calditrichia bacterium]
MFAHLKKIVILLSILVLVLFAIFLLNQTVQLVQLAKGIHPLLGQILLWVLLLLYLILLVVPVYMYFRLPPALKPPLEENPEATEKYLKQLAARLRKNPHLKDHALASREEIENALNSLDKQADELIKRSATTVFVTTAISQSGRLDAFTVLIALTRLVWQVASLYYQRPSWREFTQLYANVAATAFVAGELEDIDIGQQVEPIIGSVLGGSLTSAIPGIHTVALIITNSLLTGATNAYLTLRVGIITKKYCSSLVQKDRKWIRRSASVEAARLLSVIVMNSAGNISKAILNAALKQPGKLSRNLIRTTWDKLSGKDRSETDFTLDM